MLMCVSRSFEIAEKFTEFFFIEQKRFLKNDNACI